LRFKGDFVTNSSSTSFIISAKKTLDREEMNAKIEISINLNDYICKTLSTEKEVIDYFCEDESYFDSDRGIIIREELKKGNVIHILNVSDEEGGIESILYSEGLDSVKMSKGIKVIFGGGY